MSWQDSWGERSYSPTRYSALTRTKRIRTGFHHPLPYPRCLCQKSPGSVNCQKLAPGQEARGKRHQQPDIPNGYCAGCHIDPSKAKGGRLFI